MDARVNEQQAPMTVDDLESLPDDGRRYELVDGRLDVSPAPIFKHSDIESRLTAHLTWIAPDDYKVLTGAGYNFHGDRTHHRIPDLSVIHADAGEEPYLTRPPLLAIEVVSPSSVLRDYHTKASEYAKSGIPAYWIINPSMDPVITELRLNDGDYDEAQRVSGDEVFRTDFPFEVTIVARWLLADGPWRKHIGGEA